MQLVVFGRAREADPEHVLVGAHLGNNRAVGGKPDLDEGAVLIAVHRELVRAVDGCKALAVRVGAEDAQKEHRARADGFQRAHVALQLPATDFGSRVHPEVHLRQVEFAGAACNALARADDLQPLVFTHALRRASDRIRNGLNGCADLGEMSGHVGIRRGVLGNEALALAFELLNEFVAQVRAGGGVKQVEEGGYAGLMRNGARLLAKPVEALEERL